MQPFLACYETIYYWCQLDACAAALACACARYSWYAACCTSCSISSRVISRCGCRVAGPTGAAPGLRSIAASQTRIVVLFCGHLTHAPTVGIVWPEGQRSGDCRNAGEGGGAGQVWSPSAGGHMRMRTAGGTCACAPGDELRRQDAAEHVANAREAIHAAGSRGGRCSAGQFSRASGLPRVAQQQASFSGSGVSVRSPDLKLIVAGGAR